MAKKKRKPTSYMMVIRAAVPARYADRMRLWSVLGAMPDGGPTHSLEILSAYYDRRGHPNARW